MKPIHISTFRPDGRLPEGSSRWWGVPDLPEGTDYPMYEDSDGNMVPYCFICQINLADIAELDTGCRLPHDGLLSFFAKIGYYLGGWSEEDFISGHISGPEDVRVIYSADTDNLAETFPDCGSADLLFPSELGMCFSQEREYLADDHGLFVQPDHREWETWDPPFEDWEILFQADSFEGDDFVLNFMDFGVLDFLISPEDLKALDFGNVRAIVLST